VQRDPQVDLIGGSRRQVEPKCEGACGGARRVAHALRLRHATGTQRIGDEIAAVETHRTEGTRRL
jgi:hypothetical protein